MIALVARAVWVRRGAAVRLEEAALPKGDLVSIDDSGAELVRLAQVNIKSARYGISGRPDRVIRNSRGYLPVELKNARSGPWTSSSRAGAARRLLLAA